MAQGVESVKIISRHLKSCDFLSKIGVKLAQKQLYLFGLNNFCRRTNEELNAAFLDFELE
jgi:hypothetical protein